MLRATIYWSAQSAILLLVALTIGFSLKSSSKSENSKHGLVRSPAEAPTKGESSIGVLYSNARNVGKSPTLNLLANGPGLPDKRHPLLCSDGDQTVNGTSDPYNGSCRHPLIPSKNRSCEPPCDWSFMSSSERNIYNTVLVNCLRIALVTAVITLVTWIACKSMRRFPNIVRFYILVCSVSFTMSGIIPTQIHTENVYCVRGDYWNAEGIVSNSIILHGAVCHYFLLALCFWLMCYVINTYLLLVLEWRSTFTNTWKLHMAELLFCFLTPLVFIGICFIVKQPGYNILFKDRFAVLPSSPMLIFCTITLPVQLCSGTALSMLISIIRRIRKVSQNSRISANVIRSDEERASIKYAERHFLAIVFIYVLSMISIFLCESFLQDKEITYLDNIQEYFSCLQAVGNCTRPRRPEFFLSSLKILTPGVFCIFSFFLLFFNKESLAVWTGWLKYARFLMSKLTCRLCLSDVDEREYEMRDTEPAVQASVVTLGIKNHNQSNINCTQESI